LLMSGSLKDGPIRSLLMSGSLKDGPIRSLDFLYRHQLSVYLHLFYFDYI
jgi:hypothetical protein